MRIFSTIFFFVAISAGNLMAAGGDSSTSSSGGSLDTSETSGGGASSSGGKTYGSESSGESYDRPDRFKEVKTQISAQNYAEAYNMLLAMDVRRDEDDRQNLLGFTSRKAGNYAVALVHYESSLEINPKHLGALEYQGELFIALGDFEKAELNLKKLKKICWLGCKERTMLVNALAAAKAN